MWYYLDKLNKSIQNFPTSFITKLFIFLNRTTALTQDGAKTEIRLVVPLQCYYLFILNKIENKVYIAVEIVALKFGRLTYMYKYVY